MGPEKVVNLYHRGEALNRTGVSCIMSGSAGGELDIVLGSIFVKSACPTDETFYNPVRFQANKTYNASTSGASQFQHALHRT